MLSIFLWIIISIVAVFVVITIIGSIKMQKSFKQTDPDAVVEVIKDKMDGDNLALVVRYNNEDWLQINEHTPLPLASTVQIIIAIAFAKRAANGEIDPNQKVSLKDLEQLDIAKTDGGAYEKWIQSLAISPGTEQVTIMDIAKGMIEFSVNANTDFLMNIIDLDYINEIPSQLGLENHDLIFPIVGSMYIPVQLMKQDKLDEQATMRKIREMPDEVYRQMATENHQRWQEEPLTQAEKNRVAKTLSVKIQRAWSDRLPHATAAGYVSIMDKLNSKNYFSQEVHTYLDPLLEYIMEKPMYQEPFLYAGQKAGSTAFCITMAMYATDKENNQASIAFFTNRLNPIEQIKLSYSLNAFKRKLLTDEDFRNSVKETLTSIDK